jgi:hypothetical protein
MLALSLVVRQTGGKKLFFWDSNHKQAMQQQLNKCLF